MQRPNRSRSEAIEILAGLALVTAALACWKAPAAIAFVGTMLLVSGLWGRRIF